MFFLSRINAASGKVQSARDAAFANKGNSDYLLTKIAIHLGGEV
jgi:hypothetical protein